VTASRRGGEGAPRILVLRLRMIGDIVLSTPILAALRRARPEARIDFLVESAYRELVDENPDLDEVIPYERGRFIACARELRRRNYDLAVDLHSVPRTAWLARLSGAPRRVGFDYPGRGFLFTDRVDPTPPRPVHSVEQMMRLLAPLGIDRHPGRVFMRSSRGAAAAEAWLAPRAGGRRAAILHIAPSNPFKRWPAERTAELARALAGRGLFPVLVGGPKDRPAAEAIAAESGAGAAAMTGELGLAALRELIARAALFVGPDSGPAHIAATTRTPMVVLYGPTRPERFRPYRVDAIRFVERGDLPCRPCRQKRCVTGDYRCMELPVEAVLEAARKVLPS